MASGFSIYVILCLVNRKLYIGQTTVSVRSRWNSHVADAQAGSRMPISLSILKHGKGAFQIWEIARASTQDELDQLEIFYIKFFDSTNQQFGYNLLPGGRGAGQKISNSLKKIPSKLKGVKHSTTRILHNSLAQKAYWSTIPKEQRKTHEWNTESREKMRAAHLGKPNPHSAESRKNIAKSARTGWVKRKQNGNAPNFSEFARRGGSSQWANLTLEERQQETLCRRKVAILKKEELKRKELYGSISV